MSDFNENENGVDNIPLPPVEPDTSQDNTINESTANISQEPPGPADMQRKKAPKWLFPTIIAAALVVVIAGIATLFLSPTVSNTFALATMKPNDYYQKIETANLTSKINSFSKNYGLMNENVKKLLKDGYNQDFTFSAKIDPSLTGMVNMADLETVGLKYNLTTKDFKSMINASLNVNDGEPINLEYFMDLDNGMMQYRIPSFNEKYLSMSLDDVYSSMGDLYGISYSQNLKEMQDLMFNGPITDAFINSTLKKYSQIITNNLNSVSLKKNVAVDKKGNTSKYTEISVAVTNEELFTIVEDILTTAIEDKNISDLCVKFGAITEEEYTTGLNSILSELQTNKESLLAAEDNLIMTVWADNKGQIMGREFAIDIDGIPATFGYRTIKKKSDLSFELWLKMASIEIISIKNDGKQTGTTYNGDMSITFYDPSSSTSNVTNIAIKDFSLTNSLDGAFSGNFNITNSALGILSFNVAYTGNMEKQDFTLDCVQGATKLVSLNMAYVMGKYKDFTVPDIADSYDINTDMNDYIESADLEGFIKELNEKIDLEIVHQNLSSFLE